MCLDSSNLLITVTDESFQMAQRVYNLADLEEMLDKNQHPHSYLQVEQALKESSEVENSGSSMSNVSIIGSKSIHRHLSTGANIHSGVDATGPVVKADYNKHLKRLMDYVCNRRPEFHIFMNQRTLEPVYQDRTEEGNGNCMQACLATLFGLPLEDCFDVHEHNLESDPGSWGLDFMEWIEAQGYEFEGSGQPLASIEDTCEVLRNGKSVNGYYLVSVPSRNFDASHAVIMDASGYVVHDPHPEKAYLNMNIVESQDLKYWYMLEKA